jgi:hypothetical protein
VIIRSDTGLIGKVNFCAQLFGSFFDLSENIALPSGNRLRVLVEATWAYRLPAKVRRVLLNRQQGVPKKVCEISWEAQVRLCARYRKLWAKAKPKQVIVTAIAREFCAFMWTIANETQVSAAK